MRKMCVIAVLTATGMCLSPECHANGYRVLAIKSAWANGMGEAVVARDDDPSTIAYNPAGLAGLDGSHLGIHATFAELNAEHTDALGNTTHNMDGWQALPSFYFATDSMHEDVIIGLGVTVPNGFATHWAGDSFARYVSTYSKLEVIDTVPCVAAKVSDAVRLGGGLDILYSKVRLDRMIDAGAAAGAPGAMDVPTSLEGDGTGLGFNLGAICDINSGQSVGISYHSAATVDYDGTLTSAGQTINAETSVDFPATVAVGYMVRASDRMSVEFDIDWTRWDRVDSIRLDLAAPAEDVTMEQDFRNTFAYKLGAEYKCTDTVALRGGYIYSEHAVPDAVWRPNLMDSDAHLFTCGVGCAFDAVTLDVAVIYVHYERRNVDNNVDYNETFSSSTVDGAYDAYSPAVSMSLTYKF